MNARVGTLAVGDFRDRARRPGYAVILLAAVALAYLTVPPVDARWTVLDVGGYRGLYTSAYVGTATALATALWLSLGGFYVVRGTVARDQSTRVGQLLAVTPLSTAGYLGVKWLSNIMVLASMAGGVAVTALVVQLARGESSTVDPVALLAPFVILALPLLTVTAAAAVVFETTPVLRGGLGNVVWFAVAPIIAIAGQSPAAPLGGLGVGAVAQSMAAALRAQGVDVEGQEFSLGLTYQDAPLRVFTWDGADFPADFVISRACLVLLAALIAVLPALWFHRFDPARAHWRPPTPARVAGDAAPGGTSVEISRAPGGGASDHRPAGPSALHVPAVQVGPGQRRGGGLPRLLDGELRILTQGIPRWWWLIVVALTVMAVVLPGTVTVALLATGVWPVLVWSRLGTQQVENDVEGLLRAYPRPRRRLLAEWGSGVVLTAVVGTGPALAMLLTGDRPGLSAWVASTLLIPSLALALGVHSRSPRLSGDLPVAVVPDRQRYRRGRPPGRGTRRRGNRRPSTPGDRGRRRGAARPGRRCGRGAHPPLAFLGPGSTRTGAGVSPDPRVGRRVVLSRG